MSSHRIFVCEAQPVVIEGLARILADTPDLLLVGTASTPNDAIAKVSELRPDIVMIDQASGLRPVFSRTGRRRLRYARRFSTRIFAQPVPVFHLLWQVGVLFVQSVWELPRLCRCWAMAATGDLHFADRAATARHSASESGRTRR